MITGLTAFDVIVLVVVLVAAWGGFSRGFVAEGIRLGGWIAAVVVTRALHTQLEPVTTRWTGNAGGGAALAVALLFFGTVLVARLLAGAVGGVTRNSVVGPVDRALGLGLGAAKGLIAASLLFLAATFGADMLNGPAARPAWLTTSRTTPLLSVTSRAIVDWVERRRHADAPAA